MRKRERENPCGVCGHYHKYEEGEVCGICGHTMPVDKTPIQVSAFPSEVLPEFLYLGSYDNASRSELLKTMGISRILNHEEERERENPCGVCGHYHKNEEGEVCDVCGHMTLGDKTPIEVNERPSEVLPKYLYVGNYHSALDYELLKTMGISGILNTVPSCQNLYKNSFTYHCLEDDKSLQFDGAVQFLEQCEKDRARVLVHCMSGKSRSPAVVIAFLMKSKRWRLEQSYQWVKERRPVVELTQAVYEQLQEYEKQIIGSSLENSGSIPLPLPVFPPSGFSFGFPKPNEPAAGALPAFNNNLGGPSIFDQPGLDIPPHEFTFGAGHPPPPASGGNLSNNDMAMDG